MDFSQFEFWTGIVHFGILSLLLLFANVLRRKIPFLRKSLLPTAVIAGFIGLLVKETVMLRLAGFEAYMETVIYLRMITYHAIAIGFIALGLKINPFMKTETRKGRNVSSGLLIVSTYLIQGIAGITLSLFLAYTFFPDLFKASGLLLPLGFGQGPGQAQNIGNLYETTHGFIGGTTFGLAVASFGFIWASSAGVIYLNYLYRKGKIEKSDEQKAALTSAQEIETPDEIPLAEAIDKFTIQVSLILVVYLATFGFIYGSNVLFNAGLLGDFGQTTVGPLIVGFNFIIGMLFALAFKRLFLWLRKVNLMTRQYPNNYMLNRIAGFVFDFMIVAAISAIRIEDLSALWIPFVLMVFTIGLVTIFYVKHLCKRIYPEYEHAATMGMFGMLSGTASTGVVLLREVDPNFKTPAASDLVVGSTMAILFGFPILLLVGFAPLGTIHTFITLGLMLVFFGIIIFALHKLNPVSDSDAR